MGVEACPHCGHLTSVYADAGNREHYPKCKLYRTPLSDLLHEILCRSGHQMDQCGYGWASYDNYRETRLWVERAGLLRDSLPQRTEKELIEVLCEIKEIANFNFYNDPKNREVVGPARYKKEGKKIIKIEDKS